MKSTLTVLFFILISCNKSADVTTESSDEKITNLTAYVSRQLTIQNDVQKILKKEADFNTLHSKFSTIKSDIELKTVLLESKIKRVDLLIELLKQQNSNLINFSKNDKSGFFNKTSDEKIASINLVLDNLSELAYSEGGARMAPPTCLETYNTAISRCRRDYAITAGVSLVSIPWTLGGGVLTWGLASVQLYFCESDAKEDYNKCKD